MYEIENDVPPLELLTQKNRKKTEWPFKKMQVDQVARFPNAKTTKERMRIINYAHNYAARHGMRFVCRTIDGLLNIWRVE